MQATITDVAFPDVFQLVVGIAHNLLGSQVKGICDKDLLAFLDTGIVAFFLEQDLGTDEHSRHIVRIKRQAAIDPLQSLVQVARLTFKVGKPCKRPGVYVFLANRLFKGIQRHRHNHLLEQNCFVRQKDRNSFANRIHPRTVFGGQRLGQGFRNFFTGNVLGRTGRNSIIHLGNDFVRCQLELSPGFGAAKNIQKICIEHKTLIIKYLHKK